MARIARLSLIVLTFMTLSNCGKVDVDHHFDGTVQVAATVNLSPSTFVPFFLIDCQTRTSGQQCYDPDASKCAACMASAVYNAVIPVPTQTVAP